MVMFPRMLAAYICSYCNITDARKIWYFFVYFHGEYLMIFWMILSGECGKWKREKRGLSVEVKRSDN